jgi:2-polyprenyl-3-methyl-5-hydroxy-6-metoxy-1,4-benzoquinol methylase
MESEYVFKTGGEDLSHNYLQPAVIKALKLIYRNGNENIKILDLGCGNGAMLRNLANLYPSYEFFGVDPSPSAQLHHNPEGRQNLKFIDWSEFKESCEKKFDVILSVEVIEHVYLPREYLALITKHLKDSGYVVITTPYHGYLKNLILAITGKLDDHFTALWDYGHIKFWSIRTLRSLFEEYHFKPHRTAFCGRFYPLSKSLLMIFKR